MVARTRPMLRYTYTACLLVDLSLDSVCSPCRLYATPHKVPAATVLVRTDTEKFYGLDNFPTNGSELGLCPRFGLMVGTRRVGVMELMRVRRTENGNLPRGRWDLPGGYRLPANVFI